MEVELKKIGCGLDTYISEQVPAAASLEDGSRYLAQDLFNI
jgi:hypothetical protein